MVLATQSPTDESLFFEKSASRFADLIVFDPTLVTDSSTWSAPVQAAKGMDWVIVNGVPVIAGGTPTGKLPGRVLRRST